MPVWLAVRRAWNCAPRFRSFSLSVSVEYGSFSSPEVGGDHERALSPDRFADELPGAETRFAGIRSWLSWPLHFSL